MCYNTGLIHNDVSVASKGIKKSNDAPTGKVFGQESLDTLHSLVWGSNMYLSFVLFSCLLI